MYRNLLIILTICGSALASTPIWQCPNKKPLPLNVQFGNCDAVPCDWSKGLDYHMTIQFVATKDFQQLRADVRLTTLGAVVPFELEQNHSEVCKNLLYGAYCPLYASEDATFDLVMRIQEQDPEVPITVEVNLVDVSDNEVNLCFRTKAQVTSFRSTQQID